MLRTTNADFFMKSLENESLYLDKYHCRFMLTGNFIEASI